MLRQLCNLRLDIQIFGVRDSDGPVPYRTVRPLPVALRLLSHRKAYRRLHSYDGSDTGLRAITPLQHLYRVLR